MGLFGGEAEPRVWGLVGQWSHLSFKLGPSFSLMLSSQPPLTSLVFLVVHLIQDIFPAVSHSPDLSFLLVPLLYGPPLDHSIRYLVSP